MEIRYDLEKPFTFIDICKIINHYLNIGFKSDDYLLDSDENELYCYMEFKSEVIIIDDYRIKFKNFSPEDALQEYKNIESMIGKEDEC